MTDNYCVIRCSEDGDTSIETMGREELIKRINENHYGKLPILKLPHHRVMCEYTGGIYIIKGDSVIPHAKATVTEWEIE